MTDIVYIPEELTIPCLPDEVKRMAGSYGLCALAKYDIAVSYLVEGEICKATIYDVVSWSIVNGRWLRLNRIDYAKSEIDLLHILGVMETNPRGNY